MSILAAHNFDVQLVVGSY